MVIIDNNINVTFKINVYIGKSFSYSKPDSKCALYIPLDSIYIPCHQTFKEFDVISACVNAVADYYDFYKNDLNHQRYIDFKVTIYLNKKSLHKTFDGNGALKFLEKLEKTDFVEVKTFEL